MRGTENGPHCAVQSALVDQGRALSALFEDTGRELAEHAPTLARELAAAAEWQARLAEFASGAAIAIEQFHKRTKHFVDKQYADAKKVRAHQRRHRHKKRKRNDTKERKSGKRRIMLDTVLRKNVGRSHSHSTSMLFTNIQTQHSPGPR